jgi:hypothetical protein
MPYDNPQVDVWGYQDFVLKHMPRVTGMFEMHPDWIQSEKYTAEYKAWLQEPHDFPIWMHHMDPRVPACVLYPRGEVTERFGRNVWKGMKEVRNYFTSTTPYALGLALLMGYKRIELYGIELSTADGYTDERDCVFFWKGKASALGVEVFVHEESGLFDEKIYPFVL